MMAEKTTTRYPSQTTLVKDDHSGDGGIGNDSADTHGDLSFLAQVAVTEHALTPLQAMRTYWHAFLWCMFMCIGALLLGYDAVVVSGSLGIPQFREDFGFVIAGQPILAASWQSAFNSVNAIGGIFGGLFAGSIQDRLGRRGAAASACGISLIAILIQFFSPKHANSMLLIGRLFNGFANTILTSCAATYNAEVSPLPLRGITAGSVNLAIILGQFISTGVIRGTGSRTDVYAYRIPFATQWIFPIILSIGLPFAPESPWWLVRKGRDDEAEKVLVRLGGPTIDARLQQHRIRETIKLEDSYASTATYADCFKGVNLKRTFVATTVFVLQQCTGVIFVLGYSTYFFELAGFSTDNAFNLGVGVTAIGVVGNLTTFYAVNRLGRRFLFNWGLTMSTIILFFVGFTWIWKVNESAKWAVSAFMIIYNFVYQASIGPLPYILFGEVPSAKLRSKTVGIAFCVTALCGLIVNIVIPYLVNPDKADLGGYVGFIFAGVSLAGTIWAYFFVPETKGRTVDELDLLYGRRVPARHFATYRLHDEDTRRA